MQSSMAVTSGVFFLLQFAECFSLTVAIPNPVVCKASCEPWMEGEAKMQSIVIT